jgi:hypothetical protein
MPRGAARGGVARVTIKADGAPASGLALEQLPSHGRGGCCPAVSDDRLALAGVRRQSSRCRCLYRAFMVAGTGASSPWSVLKRQVYLGSDAFVAKMQGMIDPERALAGVPMCQRRPVAKPLEQFAARDKDRDRALAAAYGTGMYRMEAITEHFGVSRMTVSRAVKKDANRSVSLGGQCEVWPQQGRRCRTAVGLAEPLAYLELRILNSCARPHKRGSESP